MSGLVALTAGGTGGHIFPAVATADALKARGWRCVLLTDERGEAFHGRDRALRTVVLPSAGPLSGLTAKAKAAWRMAAGVRVSAALFGEERPTVLAGFGGHGSVPAMTAAALRGIPLVLHEQNAVLGRANRLFVGRAASVALGMTPTDGAPDDAVFTGIPVRTDIAALHDADYAPPKPGERLNVLVTGGSQGAKSFADILPEALARMRKAERARLKITHQCRPEDLERVRAAYKALPELETETATFLHDMAHRLGDAHLGLMRAGASTCAEILAAGLPAILVPYPYAKDDHQAANAAALARQHAAIGATLSYSERFADASLFDANWLARELRAFLEQPTRLLELAGAAKTWARIDAAERLADTVDAVAVSADC